MFITLPAGRASVLPVAKIVTLLVLLMQFYAQDFGHQRSPALVYRTTSHQNQSVNRA